jgi:hypothetical protein
MKLKYINPIIKKNKSLKKKIYFADFETTIYNNKHYVTCVSVVGLNSTFGPITYCIADYTEGYNIIHNSELVIQNFINYLLKNESSSSKINTKFVYFHNLGKFDGLFILYYLTNKLDGMNLDLITRDNVIYEIKLKYRNTKIVFRDSLLLFPQSLNKMGEIFVKRTKIDFKYIGAPIEFYTSQFKRELIQYCEEDTLLLRDSMVAYSKVVMDNFNISIYDVITLSALAFKIYRTNFYKEAIIYQSYKHIDEFIRRSYRGGVVDVFRPILGNGYYYDVNSLYPFVMSTNDMPVGKPIKGNASSEESFDINNFFGFIRVKVTTPQYLYIPYLSVKDKELGLISPLGEWEDVYFSEEIKYAIRLGYKFEYLDYYKFERKEIFSDYVNTLYKIRVDNKDQPELSNVFKLLLNSLYGRFGMAQSQFKNEFVANSNKERLYNIIKIYNSSIVSDFTTSKNISYTLIRYNELPNQDHLNNMFKNNFISEEEFNSLKKYSDMKIQKLNIAVHIASAITAYARIYMHKFKMQYKDSIYYSDTDSLILDKKISDDLISDNKLGLFKLEHKIKRGVFIAPKLYYLENETGDIMKSKGIDPKQLNYQIFIDLYNSETKTFNIKRWFIKNYNKFTIGVNEHQITISGKFYKRNKIFDKNGKWVDTKPIKI